MRTDAEYAAVAAEYVAGVRDGSVPACKWVRLACERESNDQQRQTDDPAFPYRYRADRGAKVCRALELLPHIKGPLAGQLIVLQPWQVWLLMTVFSWAHPVTGCRRFKIVYIEVPRKNAKSTLTAGVALYMLTADQEGGPEVYSLGTMRDQAKIVFGVARHMARRSPDFRSFFGVQVNAHSIEVADTAGYFVALSADADTLDGLNPHFASEDELHAHKKRDVWDVIETAMGAREQPLHWAITTAGTNTAGICYEQRGYVLKLLDGTVQDDTYFGVVYTIDEEDLEAWDTEAVWRKANPNYGISVREDDLQRLAVKARAIPSARSNFLRKRLDVWVGAASPWMSMEAWQACAGTVDVDALKGVPCWIGIDLAGRRDIAAMVAVWRLDQTPPRFVVKGWFYLPQYAVDISGNAQYSGWVREGHLITTPGNTTDFPTIENNVLALYARCNVRGVPHDPHQAWEFSSRLLDAGVPMLEIVQKAAFYNIPMREIEAAVIDGRLVHDGNPALTWQISNVVAKENAAGLLYPRKEQPENKIDGAVALLMGAGQALAPQPAPAPAPMVSTLDDY